MTKTSRNPASASEGSFQRHYAAIWGAERWNNSLYPALASPTRQCMLMNRYATETISSEPEGQACDLEQVRFPSVTGTNHIHCLHCLVNKHFDADTDACQAVLPMPRLVAVSGSSQRLMSHWNLDAASVLVANLLGVLPGETVLDLCAAPGGKSITLAQNIWPSLHSTKRDGTASQVRPQGHLTSNESDGVRYKRLNANFKTYFPVALFESNSISVHQVSGTEPLSYRQFSIGGVGHDKVLVDAPCSSERHIVHAHIAAQAGGRTAPEIANWRPGSSKRLAKTQIDLLMTGLKAAKIGGSILYATCSIEPAENDGVVEKVLATVQKEAKRGTSWTIRTGFNGGTGKPDLEQVLEQDWAERTQYGWIVLPDHSSGHRYGPLYFAMLTKVALPQL